MYSHMAKKKKNLIELSVSIVLFTFICLKFKTAWCAAMLTSASLLTHSHKEKFGFLKGSYALLYAAGAHK